LEFHYETAESDEDEAARRDGAKEHEEERIRRPRDDQRHLNHRHGAND